MAKITPTHPISDIHGAFRQGDKVIFRMRDGIQHAYIVKHPYEGPYTEAQKAARSTFRNLTQQVKAIYANPEQLAEWRARFETFISSRQYKTAFERYLRQEHEPQRVPYVAAAKRFPKPPTTLYGFIISTLSKS